MSVLPCHSSSCFIICVVRVVRIILLCQVRNILAVHLKVVGGEVIRESRSCFLRLCTSRGHLAEVKHLRVCWRI